MDLSSSANKNFHLKFDKKKRDGSIGSSRLLEFINFEKVNKAPNLDWFLFQFVLHPQLTF
ncbi:MAG: hypothetical protein CL402_00180 [Acidiferrobacteraceae bacterium]|nr:hypothetical protein [Acidiferrobacteraceae bacterium]|tara:strand:+ start:3101 stop:3280 length:180 start_codon:yes stop_codon:yes gene_type:complete